MTELHHISILKGGYCSEHRHNKFNLFYIISGKLKVFIWLDGQTLDTTIIGPEEVTTVQPRVWHKFEALEDTECVELYYILLESPDIERRTQGGIKK